MLLVAFDLRQIDTDRQLARNSDPSFRNALGMLSNNNGEQAAIFNEDEGSYTSSIDD